MIILLNFAGIEYVVWMECERIFNGLGIGKSEKLEGREEEFNVFIHSAKLITSQCNTSKQISTIYTFCIVKNK